MPRILPRRGVAFYSGGGSASSGDAVPSGGGESGRASAVSLPSLSSFPIASGLVSAGEEVMVAPSKSSREYPSTLTSCPVATSTANQISPWLETICGSLAHPVDVLDGAVDVSAGQEELRGPMRIALPCARGGVFRVPYSPSVASLGSARSFLRRTTTDQIANVNSNSPQMMSATICACRHHTMSKAPGMV